MIGTEEEVYFMVEPSLFKNIGSIDKDGNENESKCQNFDFGDPEKNHDFNYLFFVTSRYIYPDGKIKYARKAKEVVTGATYDITIAYDRTTENAIIYELENTSTLMDLSSKTYLELHEVSLKKAAGRLAALRRDKELEKQYVDQLNALYRAADKEVKSYDSMVEGPSRKLVNGLNTKAFFRGLFHK